jgi:malate dehydrogenase
MKVSVIGAGNVGATCANEIINMDLVNELVLVDIKDGMVQGKALDLWQTSSILQFDTRVRGVVDDYEATANSDVIVITSGLPRKPGMSRDDLIKINATIVKDVTKKSIVHSPQAKIIVVSNPLDVMTYAAYLAANEVLPKRSSEIFGMAGILDTARYKAFIADALNISPKSIHAILMGGHGDTMVPLPRYTSVASIPILELMDRKTLDSIIERTKVGGGEIVKLMGTSAWYAPGAAAAQMVEAIVKNSRRIFPVCASLNGEYSLSDLYLGVPVVLGRNGVERIIELDLNTEEKELLYTSAKAVKQTMSTLDDMNLFTQKYGRTNPVPEAK